MSSYQTQKSTKNSALRNATAERIISIDWQLLFRRLRLRFGQLFRSARHRAAQTEYTPPNWIRNFRLSWFRLGLIAIALFVFTQKQIDFTVSVGKLGLSAGSAPATAATTIANRPTAAATPAPKMTSQLSVIPAKPAAPVASPSASNWQVTQYDVATVRSYINRFERVAHTEADKYGIPAAAKLAIAILESHAGTSPKAIENNNHFGSITANGFYANAWNNWRAHSELIRNEFPELISLQHNYQQWITALNGTNYSSDPQYGQKLLAIIEHFNLG